MRELFQAMQDYPGESIGLAVVIIIVVSIIAGAFKWS
jgi:hypothetical protein